jgi:hypothetical protein
MQCKKLAMLLLLLLLLVVPPQPSPALPVALTHL